MVHDSLGMIDRAQFAVKCPKSESPGLGSPALLRPGSPISIEGITVQAISHSTLGASRNASASAHNSAPVPSAHASASAHSPTATRNTQPTALEQLTTRRIAAPDRRPPCTLNPCQPRQSHRRCPQGSASSAHVFPTTLVSSCSSSWPAAWTISIASAPSTFPWEELAASAYISGNPFDDAMKQTYANFSQFTPAGAEDELAEMIKWFRSSSAASSLAGVVELDSITVREVFDDALVLAEAKECFPNLGDVLVNMASQLKKISPNYGYPAVRRVVIGALTHQRKKCRRAFLDKEQEQVETIFQRLFQLHTEAAALKGAVQFFHISKSGGTNLCQAAQANGCSTEGFDERKNCMIADFEDTPRWLTQNGHKYVNNRMVEPKSTPWFVNFHQGRKNLKSCEERLAYLKQANWDFYANEYTIPSGEPSLCRQFSHMLMFRNPIQPTGTSTPMSTPSHPESRVCAANWDFYANEYTIPSGEPSLCRQFSHMLMFRDPIKRLRSHMSWIQKLYKELYVETNTSEVFENRTSGFWERLLPAGVNNYYIRSLLGERMFRYPVLPLNLTHAHKASLQVLQHDVLLTLENREFNDVTMRLGMGWENPLQEGQIRSSSHMKDEIKMPPDYQRLISNNQLDMKV
eukprot:gene2688-12920_t